jgi:hypothetical protein
MNRFPFVLPAMFALIFLAACATQTPTCPKGIETPQYLMVAPDALPTPTPNPESMPVKMEIRGKTVSVGKIVEGPLCNDTWSGTIYVTCNIQVYSWKESPNFLKNCKLSIEPDTVIYVAYHNDAAYYNGCSCHTGEVVEP